jgi:hypothetical protein
VHWQLHCFPWINTYTLAEVSSHYTYYVGVFKPVKQFTWYEGYSGGSAKVSQEGGIKINLHNTRRKDKYKLSSFYDRPKNRGIMHIVAYLLRLLLSNGSVNKSQQRGCFL